jgi:hypothetical protein
VRTGVHNGLDRGMSALGDLRSPVVLVFKDGVFTCL